jgi:hypothetical protein
MNGSEAVSRSCRDREKNSNACRDRKLGEAEVLCIFFFDMDAACTVHAPFSLFLYDRIGLHGSIKGFPDRRTTMMKIVWPDIS